MVCITALADSALVAKKNDSILFCPSFGSVALTLTDSSFGINKKASFLFISLLGRVALLLARPALETKEYRNNILLLLVWACGEIARQFLAHPSFDKNTKMNYCILILLGRVAQLG